MAGEGDAVEPSSEEDARMRNLVGEGGWSGQARRLAGWLNPVVASPAAPLETFAALDATTVPDLSAVVVEATADGVIVTYAPSEAPS